MNISLGNKFGKTLQGRVEKYEFEVGILEDAPHYEPKDGSLGEYAAGPIRRQSNVDSGLSNGEVLIKNMERLNINILLRPFQEKSSDILKFTNYFLKFVIQESGERSLKRLENLLQAIVRNPILKQEYGPNNPATADAKGFDRHLFDTGQMFKAIKARARRV